MCIKQTIVCLCSLICVLNCNFNSEDLNQENSLSYSSENISINTSVILKEEANFIGNFNYYFYKNNTLISKYSLDDLTNKTLLNQLQEDALIADGMAISTSDELPEKDHFVDRKQVKNLKLALSSEKNMATHGKMFWWGYQVYFNHQTMKDIESAISIGSAASTGLTAILSVVAAETGAVVGVLCAFVFANFAIMKAFDKGEGATMTQEIWGPGIYWFNSGNCVRGE